MFAVSETLNMSFIEAGKIVTLGEVAHQTENFLPL